MTDSLVGEHPKRGRTTRTRLLLLSIVSLGIASVISAAAAATSSILAGPYLALARSPRRKSRAKKSKGLEIKEDEEVPWLVTNTNEKLARLIESGFTSADIAIASGSSLRTVEDRRRKLREPATTKTRSAKLDSGIDELYSIFTVLEQHKIEPSNIRAWLIGRSMYLEEQRPAVLLSAGEFELVREAAIAYATGETPQEFLTGRDLLPRPTESVDV